MALVLPEPRTGSGVQTLRSTGSRSRRSVRKSSNGRSGIPGATVAEKRSSRSFVCRRCTSSVSGGRTLTVSPQELHEALQARRAEQREQALHQEYAARSGIEGSLSEGVRAHGMRRSRSQGRDTMHVQMVSVAAALSLVRIHHMLERAKAGLSPRRVRRPSAIVRIQDRKVA